MKLEFFILFSLGLAATFFVVLASIALIVRKAIGVRRERSEERLYGYYSTRLAELLLTDLPALEDEGKTASVLHRYELVLSPMKKQLARLSAGRRRYHRSALESVLIDLAHDVTGETADRLTYFFASLGFVQSQMLRLRSKHWWFRAEAARTVGLLRARKAIPLLALALEDRHPDVRHQVMQSLVQLKGVESLRTILAIARRLSQWTAVELSVIVMQFKEAAVPYLIEGLKSPDQSVVLFSMEMLAEIGFTSAVEPLRALLRDYPSSVVQAKAAEALGRLGDERAEEALLKLASSPHPHLRSKAIEALGRIGSASAIPVLMQQFEKGTQSEKLSTARAIAELGEEGVSAIRSLARDESELNRAVALQVAEEYSIDIGA